MTYFRTISLAALLAALWAAPAAAQNGQNTFDFSIANIMRGPELYGREPQRVRWSADGKWIYFYWNPPGTKWSEPLWPHRVRAQAGATPERLTEAQVDSAGPLFADGSYTRDRRLKAVAYEGDLYVVDMRLATVRRLTQTVGVETTPAITADGSGVYFVRDNNIYFVDLARSLVSQITDVRTGPAPREDSAYTGQRGVLRSQQRELFDAVRERSRLDSISRSDRRAHEARQPKPLYLAKDERVTQLNVSPNGSALVLVTSVPATTARETEVPQYVTASGYTEDLRVRTKVGDDQASGRVALVPLPGGDVQWLKVIPTDTARAPAFAFSAGWNDSGTAALLVAVARDYKSRYVHSVSTTGALTTIDVLRDTAWVLTGRGGGNACGLCAGWLDGDRVWFTSEADGFAHVYTASAKGGDKRQLTSGKWEVLDVALSADRRTFFLTSSENSPFDAQLYRMSVAGGPRTRVTTQAGSHQSALSPDEQWIADVYSFSNKPPELYLARNQPGVSDMARLTSSPTADWQSFKWLAPQIVWINASDGVKVPARIYKPADLGARGNGAAVIFVHGAGYLHNVHNFWSSYSREYMFNHFLASRGYIVLDIDYRGSAGYGRDWRTAIYRHMGGRDLQDQVDGTRYLEKELGISPERVGIYGGSYGGFMTLMALFTEPSRFGAGAALRSVTDWAHYNHQYTSQILNTPDKDSVAYRQSSPIYFAAGLADPLLMAHGMVDVNVHFQDIVRLTQKLVELGKSDWELAVYPVEDHGFVRPDSWTDEYTRIFKLFERTIAAPREAKTTSTGRQ
ncbi:MAG TPA: prolyl oligopeptidase family serine peptidase [Gemmatimonadaceae bacterium]|nr:prolyl oligopeptidase family serine peptidase [Gemmatimonadaceae bacterium]